MKLKIDDELNLLPDNPYKSKKIDKSKYYIFLKNNANKIDILNEIKDIRSITKTWYVYQKLSSEIMGWGELELEWIIKIKEIIHNKPNLLSVKPRDVFDFYQEKQQIEKELKITSKPEKEIKCSTLKFERNDDYEILF